MKDIDVIEALLDILAERTAAKLAAKLKLGNREDAENPDELLPVNRIAKILRLRQEEVTRLIDNGALLRAPDIAARRVKRSEVRRYATREK